METNQLKKPQMSVKTMSPEQKEQLIKQFQRELETTTDMKRKNNLTSRIKYLQNPEQKKQKRRELYLKKNKDNIQKKCEEKLERLKQITPDQNS
jgi:hypothetical protein